MNPSQKLGLFILIAITVVYVYFSFFNKNGFDFELPKRGEANSSITEIPDIIEVEEPPIEEPAKEKTYKTVKIFVSDSSGKLRSVNRKCDTEKENSCFAYAIKELVSAGRIEKPAWDERLEYSLEEINQKNYELLEEIKKK